MGTVRMGPRLVSDRAWNTFVRRKETNPLMHTLMDEGCFFSFILGLCWPGLLPPPAWVMGGLPHLGETGGPQTAGAGRLGLSRSGLARTPAPLSCWGWGDEEGVQPISSTPPLRPLLPLSLCRNHKIPVQRQEMGLFLALWGKKRKASLLFKNIWCVCWAGEELDGAQSLCWQEGGPAPGPRGPATLHGSLAHMATLGSYCFLARPERNGILIKTNSSHQNKGEEPANCSHLDACFHRPGSMEGSGWS